MQETVGVISISNDNIATYTYTDNANNNIAYIGISCYDELAQKNFVTGGIFL